MGLSSNREVHRREGPQDQTGLVLYVCFPLFSHLRPAEDLRSSYLKHLRSVDTPRSFRENQKYTECCDCTDDAE